MARNKLAGTKVGKSRTSVFYQENPEARAKQIAYNKKVNATKKAKKYRTELQKINRKIGKPGDGKDFDHATGKLVSQKVNRGRNSKSKKSTPGDRRARG